MASSNDSISHCRVQTLLQPTHQFSAKKQLKLKHDHNLVLGHQDWPPKMRSMWDFTPTSLATCLKATTLPTCERGKENIAKAQQARLLPPASVHGSLAAWQPCICVLPLYVSPCSTQDLSLPSRALLVCLT